jgi:hypothetical protein
MAAQWPRIVSGLVALLPTLTGWSGVSVFDGAPITADDPLDYCTVGFVNAVATDDVAGSYMTSQDPDGFQIQETGQIRCQITVQTGNVDTMSAMRSAMFALTDALDAAIRLDRTLGGLLAPASDVSLAVDVQSIQNQGGTAQSAVFTVHYFTVT